MATTVTATAADASATDVATLCLQPRNIWMLNSVGTVLYGAISAD